MRQNGFYRHARATDRDAARVRADHEQAQRDAMRARAIEAKRVEAERVPLTRDDFNGKQYALRTEQAHGVWGGVSARDRARMRKDAA